MKKHMWVFFTIILIVSALLVLVIRRSILNKNCIKYIKDTATTTDVIQAENNLSKAIEYLETNNLTKGNTGCFTKVSDDDINDWYQTLKYYQSEFQEIIKNDIESYKGAYMILNFQKEMLTSEGEVFYPEHLEIYPYQLIWTIILIIGIVIFVISYMSWMKEVGMKR